MFSSQEENLGDSECLLVDYIAYKEFKEWH